MSGTVLEDTKKFGVHSIPGPGQRNNIEKVLKSKDTKPKAETTKAITSNLGPPSIDLEQLILSTLSSGSDIADSWVFAEENNQDHQTLVGAIKSLLVDAYVTDVPITSSFWVLTDEGSDIAKNGSPEFQVYKAVPSEGVNVVDLNASLGEVAKIGLGPCMKNKWLKKDGDRILRLVEGVKDETASNLAAIADPSSASATSEEELKNLKRRKLVNQIVRKSYKITKGVEFKPLRVKRAADLTKEMLGLASDVSYCIYSDIFTADVVLLLSTKRV